MWFRQSEHLAGLLQVPRSGFQRNYDAIMTALKRSTLISEVGEKERSKFANKCHARIDQLRSKIENSEME